MTYSTSDAYFSIFDAPPTPPSIIANSVNPRTFYPGDLSYESTDAQTQLSLENGAVVKMMLAENGSTMLAEPRWYYDSQTNTAVIYLIGFNTSTNDVMGLEGVGTVRMALVQTNYTVYNLPANDPVYVSYSPNAAADYSAAWDNYFTGTLGMLSTAVPGRYILPTASQPARIVIYTYEIMIESV
jgi:hypothetical protein